MNRDYTLWRKKGGGGDKIKRALETYGTSPHTLALPSKSRGGQDRGTQCICSVSQCAICMHIQEGQQNRMLGIQFNHSPSCSTEAHLSLACVLGGQPQPPGILCLCPSSFLLVLSLQPGFLFGCWNPNSGPHASLQQRHRHNEPAWWLTAVTPVTAK